MNLADQFDRLDKLIIDRSTNISTMRGILHLIREQVEAYEAKAKEQDALKAENKKLIATVTKLQASDQKPSIEVIDLAPNEPIEPLM